MEEAYIGLEEVANFLNIKIPTIRKWLKDKDSLPKYKVGKQWKFKKIELDEWVKSGRSAK